MMDCGSTVLIFLAFIQATCGQSVTLTGLPAIEQGSDTVYTCTGGAAPYTFTWTDNSVIPSVPIFLGVEKAYPPDDPKYVNFNVSANEGTSTMTIYNTLIEDEGQYRCGEGQASDEAEFTVEVKSTRSLSVETTIESNFDMYIATCEALGGRPDETITWMLGDGPAPCDNPVETNPTAGPDLSSKTSVCKFQATSENYNQVLKCVISGHLVSELNGEETTTLDMHSYPGADIITVGIQILLNSSVRVSCDIGDVNQTDPRIRNYYIYSDSTLIHQSSTGVNFVVVTESEYDPDIEYNCVAGNYLGNTTTFEPISTTTPPPTTALEGTSPVVDSGTPGTEPKGLSGGAVAGIVIGVSACIVIIIVVILYLVKPECCPCFATAGLKSSGSGKKPAGSAVGSSNGSEKNDVEAPLNGVKDVTAEDKINQPVAAQRSQAPIQHTASNPGQELYALPERKQPAGGRGGDAPDRGSGPGQNEPQGMLYADLDLSSKAGHTEKHIPKNENDVVVYSSILV